MMIFIAHTMKERYGLHFYFNENLICIRMYLMQNPTNKMGEIGPLKGLNISPHTLTMKKNS